jgi:hypothetical protein
MEIFMIVIIMPFILPVIFIVQKYISFKTSAYKAASGNSFMSTLSDKGNYGEYLTFAYLEKLAGDNKLITNLYLPKKDGSTTEIDLLMLSAKGIFIFESKNYSGWIFGDETSRYWTQTLSGRQKNKFFNPIWQNKGHINAFKSVTGVENDSFYKSYIIFSERCTLKKINVISPNVKVINRYDLLQAIKGDIEGSPCILSREDTELLFRQLLQYSKADTAVKETHIKGIRRKGI